MLNGSALICDGHFNERNNTQRVSLIVPGRGGGGGGRDARLEYEMGTLAGDGIFPHHTPFNSHACHSRLIEDVAHPGQEGRSATGDRHWSWSTICDLRPVLRR